jgi:hypothetical protein
LRLRSCGDFGLHGLQHADRLAPQHQTRIGRRIMNDEEVSGVAILTARKGTKV